MCVSLCVVRFNFGTLCKRATESVPLQMEVRFKLSAEIRYAQGKANDSDDFIMFQLGNLVFCKESMSCLSSQIFHSIRLPSYFKSGGLWFRVSVCVSQILLNSSNASQSK